MEGDDKKTFFLFLSVCLSPTLERYREQSRGSRERSREIDR
jgi:hypothetical protein